MDKVACCHDFCSHKKELCGYDWATVSIITINVSLNCGYDCSLFHFLSINVLDVSFDALWWWKPYEEKRLLLTSNMCQ